MDRTKIAFQANLGFDSMKPIDVITSLKNLGYKGVEWRNTQFNVKKKNLDELKELIDMTRDNGLEVTGIDFKEDFVFLNETDRQASIDHMKEGIEACAECGVRNFVTLTGPRPWEKDAPKLGVDISEGEAWDQVIRGYRELAKTAEEKKVFIAVEAVWNNLARDYYTVKELIDNVRSDYVGINLDPSHFAVYRNDIPWAVRRLGPKIHNVHIKDAAGGIGFAGETFIFPLIGEGMIDWKEFFDVLEEVKYDWYFVIEFESFDYYEKTLKGDIVKAAEISIRDLKAVLGL